MQILSYFLWIFLYPYNPYMKNIIIIWAWAAGLMTTATILEYLTPSPSPSERGISGTHPLLPHSSTSPFHIHLFEKNTSPGKKVIISGGGRCNVTTSIEDKKTLATKYVRGWDFIRKAIGKFSPKKCREWFESHGVPLKIQADLRVFPVSDDGRDIVWVFEDIFAKHRDKISIHYWEWASDVSILPSSWTEWRIQESTKQDMDSSSYSEWQKQWFLVTTSKWQYQADILVITTGWNAYSHTGSSGDGYAFARALGHTVTTLWPSLSSFLTGEKWLHELSGLAFEDAGVSFSLPSRQGEDIIFQSDRMTQNQEPRTKNQELIWPLLLTHFGISWPLAFMASSHLAWDPIGKWHEKTLYLKPIRTLSEKDWDEYLKKSFAEHPKKLITSILADKLPRRFVDAFVTEYFSHITDTFAASISRADREKIANLLGAWIPLTLLERRPGDEFVTAGGVSTDEIDPETMESKIHKNLYFAGEVLNVDGYTWGFSLQICWASGYTAGKDIISKF